MFTGIIEKIGTVSHLQQKETERVLTFSTGFSDLQRGESVAINGVCLTVVADQGGMATFYVSPETLEKTNLGTLNVGDSVNLERALMAGGRLSGHWVQGHVDGRAELLEIRPTGESHELRVRVPSSTARAFVEKGSITLDGVSLTINSLTDTSAGTELFLMIIPHTWTHTHFSTLSVGHFFNFEIDILAKYMERLWETSQPLNRP